MKNISCKVKTWGKRKTILLQSRRNVFKKHAFHVRINSAQVGFHFANLRSDVCEEHRYNQWPCSTSVRKELKFCSLLFCCCWLYAFYMLIYLFQANISSSGCSYVKVFCFMASCKSGQANVCVRLMPMISLMYFEEHYTSYIHSILAVACNHSNRYQY